MKLGLQINNFGWAGGPTRSGATLVEIARTAEDCASIASGWPITSGSTR